MHVSMVCIALLLTNSKLSKVTSNICPVLYLDRFLVLTNDWVVWQVMEMSRHCVCGRGVFDYNLLYLLLDDGIVVL